MPKFIRNSYTYACKVCQEEYTSELEERAIAAAKACEEQVQEFTHGFSLGAEVLVAGVPSRSEKDKKGIVVAIGFEQRSHRPLYRVDLADAGQIVVEAERVFQYTFGLVVKT